MELVHFKRVGYSKHLKLVYNDFVIKAIGYNPEKKSNVNIIAEMFKNYNNDVSEVIKKDFWEFKKIASLEEVIPAIEKFINTNLKQNEKSVKIESWIESYAPGFNKNLINSYGFSYLKEDKNIMSAVLKNGKISTLDTDKYKGKDINIYKTWDMFYSDKAILPIKEELLNPSPKLLDSSLTKIYLYIHDNSYKKDFKSKFNEYFQYKNSERELEI